MMQPVQTIFMNSGNILAESLDVISVNIWHILISLINLVLMFLLVKKFLYKPVKKMMKERQDAVDRQYADAEKAKQNAEETERQWNEAMLSAKDQADDILARATEQADLRGKQMIAEATEKADGIVRRAENQAELEKKKAKAEIKQEIVSVSTAIAEKILEREITSTDHDALIDSVIGQIGEGNEKLD